MIVSEFRTLILLNWQVAHQSAVISKKTILFYASINKTECIYIIPYIIFGYPKYDIKKVSKYIITKIKKKNIFIILIQPNILYINWVNI